MRISVLFFPLLCGLYLFTSFAAWAAFDPEPLQRQARELLAQGEILESAAAWEQLYQLAAEPDVRARALVRQGDIAALFQNAPAVALTLYDRAIEEFPGSPELENAYFNAAMLRYEQGRYADAEQGFAGYLHVFPQGRRARTARYMLERSQRERSAPAPEAKPEESATAGAQKEPVVRVRLKLSDSVELTAPHGGHLLLEDGGYESLGRTEYLFFQREGQIWLDGHASGRALGQRVTLLPEGGGFLWQGKAYPGEAALSIHEGRLLLVNRLPLETYLWGVVPAEMPASFAAAALQAQAVAARSYALALLRGSGRKEWDVLASRLSQVYKGVRAGDPRVKQAVESTSGEVLQREGRPVLSYFHSHSGGVLEDDAEVWNGDLPYYRVQQDPASNEARAMRWSLEVGYDELAGALRKEGLKVDTVRGLEVLSRTASGRLGRLRLRTGSGSLELRGTLLRKALGPGRMKSTLAEISTTPGGIRIQGRGFGHGVGMSQWGAQGMAKAGKEYREILAQYYPGVAVEKLW